MFGVGAFSTCTRFEERAPSESEPSESEAPDSEARALFLLVLMEMERLTVSERSEPDDDSREHSMTLGVLGEQCSSLEELITMWTKQLVRKKKGEEVIRLRLLKEEDNWLQSRRLNRGRSSPLPVAKLKSK